jgi:UDP-glucose 4-epimerase
MSHLEAVKELKKNFLVTGGAGFIGINLVHRLLNGGARVRVLDNLSSGRGEDLAGLPLDLVVGDIRDWEVVNQAMAGIEVVVHLAAHTNVVQSVKSPWTNLQVNIEGTFKLLEASLQHRVDRFIFASSAGAILGEVEPPVHEEMPPHPISPYGASKLAGEGYCSVFWGCYGLKTLSLRFSNVYGPYSYHKGSVIAKFFRRILKGQELTIFGNGEQTRDFIYVADLCGAILAAVRCEVPYGQAIMLGSGTQTSINNLVATIKRVIGPGRFPPIRYAPRLPGEVLRNYVSLARAREYLDFAPQTGLVEGLRRTWEWFVQCRAME